MTLLKRISTYLILGACMALTFAGVWWSPFAEDESQWIYTTRYLTLFSRGIWDSPEWGSYWPQTQPPMARYVMGTSLKAGGYNLLALNGPWDFAKEPDVNVAEGNMPTPGMLFWARLPMGLAAAASVLIIFWIGSLVGGTISGLGAAAWLTLNTRARDLMTRAEADGLLIFFILAGLLLAILLVERLTPTPGKDKRVALVAIIAGLGLAFGLGIATKLTAIIGLVALPTALLAVFIFRWIRVRALSRQGVASAVGISIAAGALALALFVALNPALYRSPVEKSIWLFRYRQMEMSLQMQKYPSGSLAEGLPRVWAGVQRPLLTFGVTASIATLLAGPDARSFGETFPLDALLVTLGLGATGWMVVAAARKIREEQADATSGTDIRRAEAAIVALVWTLVFFALIVMNMGLDWDRYTLPLMVFAALWAGVGIGWLAGLVSRLVGRT